VPKEEADRVHPRGLWPIGFQKLVLMREKGSAGYDRLHGASLDHLSV